LKNEHDLTKSKVLKAERAILKAEVIFT